MNQCVYSVSATVLQVLEWSTLLSHCLTLFPRQLAKPVDVIGSREVTPVPEEADAQARWVSPGQVQAELDELARASKRFLEVSDKHPHGISDCGGTMVRKESRASLGSYMACSLYSSRTLLH